MTDLRHSYLQGMSFAAATVNIVTTDGIAGRSGVTVSAMSSVSADTEKPTLLVCVNDSSSGAAPIIENGVFCVNILRDDQSFISDTFAGRHGHKGDAKFGCGEWKELATGAPVLTNALVAFDCKLTNDVVVGTHHVFFGEVQAMQVAPSGMPLIYANRAYGTPFHLPASALAKSSGKAPLDTIRLGSLSSFGPFFLPGLLKHVQQSEAGLSVEVIEGDQAQALGSISSQDADLALVYDRDLPDSVVATRLAELRPYILLPAAHRLSGKDSIALAELISEPLILLDAPLSRDYFLSLFESAGLTPLIGMRTSSFEMVRSMVGNQAGYAILVTRPTAMSSYDGKPLVAIPIRDNIHPIDIAIVHRANAKLSKTAQSFVQQCETFFIRQGME